MKLSYEIVLPLLFIALCAVVVFVRWNKPFDLLRALSINFMCSACYAGPFVRVGWDKALVAFLVIFGITSLFSMAIWSDRRSRQRLTSKPPESS